MRRLVIAVVAALALLTGTGAASLAAGPFGSLEGVCGFASGQTPREGYECDNVPPGLAD